MFIPIMLFMMGHAVAQTVTVNSLSELLPYLKQSDVDVKLAPGTYTIDDTDIDNGTFSNPLFLFEGSNSVYDFTDVKIEINTIVLTKFGNVDVNEIQILGNNNVLNNLTLEDIGTTAPTNRAQSIVMDGRDNRIEGFDLTIRGSFPYGYGDAFGKGGGSVINHRKHSGVLIRGLRNHLKNCNIISRSYGHIVFMQAASYPTVEGCYIEGEMRSTDDMLAEAGTGSPADNVDFMTVWGYKLPAGYMMSLQEGGIRAYDAGTTYIDGEEIQRGTDNPTVLNCTIKNARTGVTLAHASGTKTVDNVTLLGCEQGYSIGSGTVSNCSADAQYGPVLSFAYSSDSNTNIDITVLPSENDYNGSGTVAYIGGNAHNITLRGSITNPDLRIQVGGQKNNVRLLGVTSSQNPLDAQNLEFTNYTDIAMVLDELSSGVVVKSCGNGTITDNGANNLLLGCNEELTFPDSNYTYFINNPRWNIRLAVNNENNLEVVSDATTGELVEWVLSETDENGYYYIDCVGANTTKRIIGNGTTLPELASTDEIGNNAKWKFDPFEDSELFFITNKNNERLRVNINHVDIVPSSSTGSYTRFSFTVSSTLSVESELVQDAIKLYPNPVSDVLNMDFNNFNPKQVEVYNLAGQQILVNEINSNTKYINLSTLSQGIYMLKIISENTVVTKKLIKQ